VAPLVVVIFGLMATGKTTLARALGEALDLPVISSDVVRKTLAGLIPATPTPLKFGTGIYAEDFSQRTYAEVRRLASQHLDSGRGVILDASFKRARERELIRQLAREHGAKIAFILCTCSLEVARGRLGIRAHDPKAISDGREELLTAQAQDFDPVSAADRPLLKLETGREWPVVLAELTNFVAPHVKEEGDRHTTRRSNRPH
jgi:predicted kinase